MKAILLATALACAPTAAAQQAYWYGSDAMNLGRSDGTAYTLGVGAEDTGSGDRWGAELQRSNTARGVNRTGFALQWAHVFDDWWGYDAYGGIGIGYAMDRPSNGGSSASGASADLELGLSHPAHVGRWGWVTFDAFLRQTHDFVPRAYQREQTAVGLRARVGW